MNKKREYRTGDIAKMLGIHDNTVRTYSDRFAHMLSSSATAAKRKYTDDDVLLLATVAEFRDTGLSFEAIQTALDNGQRVVSIPPLPTEAEEKARQDVALTPTPEYERALDNVQRLQGELQRVVSERDNAIAKYETETSEIRLAWKAEADKLNQRIVELERDKSLMEGRLQVIETERRPAQYWLQVIVIIVGIAILLTIIAGVLIANLYRA